MGKLKHNPYNANHKKEMNKNKWVRLIIKDKKYAIKLPMH